MEKLIKKVYIDQNQCEEFGVEYFNSCGFKISVRDLKNSKDYDNSHNNLFSAYPNELFHLRREESHAPGWYDWSLC